MPHIYLLEFPQTALLVEQTLMIFLSVSETELVLKIKNTFRDEKENLAGFEDN